MIILKTKKMFNKEKSEYFRKKYYEKYPEKLLTKLLEDITIRTESDKDDKRS